MKSRILTLIAITTILVSCGTQKTAVAAKDSSAVTTETKVALTPELLEGQNLYSNNCAKCHKLYEPKKFTKEEWQPILVRMQKKAKVDDVNMASITNYIHSQL
ncbi:cytochrome c [Flavobacterium reichenbachii]|uniref:Cytochrome C n=1 Tax=Flavobacterium reichenbachii TaxID=362418 RepID=A0A085ZP53_9FLAO|nr:cytochrome c [Flavobacterium reichenbachii]KFF06217.1 cytochrome C [Flavobacterium reichenbachii]OXB17567.1 cytochrome C [Flavobacterium reichenbachii]